MVTTLDTNVAIYAFSDVEPKAQLAAAVIAGSSFVSVQVFNEFASVMRRRWQLPFSQIEQLLDRLRTAVGRIAPIDEQVHVEGLRLTQRYKLEIYDAMIVAVALLGEATILFSEDMHHGLVIDDRLTIQNPFRVA